MKTYHSFSSKETEKIGETIAKNITRLHRSALARHEKRKKAVVFALHGDLGSGKTTFVKGFFRGLGVKGRVKSPTFIIMRRSGIRGKIFTNVFHIDAYRLRKADDLLAIDFKTIIGDLRNIILIEWPENAKGMIPRGAHRLKFTYGKKENERTIKTL